MSIVCAREHRIAEHLCAAQRFFRTHGRGISLKRRSGAHPPRAFHRARSHGRRLSYIKSTTVSFVSSAVHRAYAWKDRRYMLADTCGKNNITHHSRTALHILPFFPAAQFPSQAQTQVEFYQPAHTRANQGTRTSTWATRCCSSGGAHGRLGRALVRYCHPARIQLGCALTSGGLGIVVVMAVRYVPRVQAQSRR
ncbi:hypothetical protein B0H16DRAFT_982537 [Mycena metata]|uniref:Uncharacterized protein n=1 Tax=Mycena metata TaxID=1033252 RepID=A0AAD7H8G6_9AGAR|nr:hypothetical protein B0H16DRAFT_523311 [Mycena metata]KAJ7745152.1 hypothetical protein B0H16DRAFT_982537 [Mycena metata]